MAAIIGIDAAWTPRAASAVALIENDASGAWRCVLAAPDAGSFVTAGGLVRPIAWALPAMLSDIVSVSSMLTTQPISIIAADLPLSRLPITGRRACDDAISRGFGRQLCSSHTPSAIRPGPISDDYRNTLGNLGFPLVTAGSAAPAQQLIEVYPHPAILTLLGAHNRLQYKVSRTLRYWPQLRYLLQARRRLLIGALTILRNGLRTVIGNVHVPIPNPNPPGTIAGLKGVEDALDALVCAWVGSQHLVGGTHAFGDANATIWVP